MQLVLKTPDCVVFTEVFAGEPAESPEPDHEPYEAKSPLILSQSFAKLA